MSHAKAARKKNKSVANAAELNSDRNTPVNQEPSFASTTIAAISPSAETAVLQVTEKSPNDILLPSMSDIEKLQKLKEWILSDQHPLFTSAPKVAYLLSLRVPVASRSVADSNGSSNSLGGDQERQVGAIPLAERLSSPKMQPYTGDGQTFNEAYENGGQHEQSDHQESHFQDDQHLSGPYEGSRGPPESDSLNDVEMADSRTQGSTGPVLTPTHAAHPYPRHYSRPSEDQRRLEAGEDGRRSPRNEPRQWQDRRGSANGNYSRNPGGDGGRYPAGNYRGGYQNHGDRRFSGSDYQQQPNYRYNEYDRNPDKRPDQSDDRYGARQPGYASRGGYQQSYGPRHTYERKGDYNRPSEREPPPPLKTDELDGAKPPEENTSPMEVQDTAENKMMTDDQNQPEKTGDSATITSPPSPASANGGPPLSVTETLTLPGLGSPQRSEAQLENGSGAPAQDDREGRDASPPSPVEGDASRDAKHREQDRDYKPNTGNYVGRNAEYRRQTYDARPKADGYQRYNHHERTTYERPPPPRDDRPYVARDPSHRPSYPPPPVDDRRFVPREPGYAEESYYSRGRDYRPQADWDAKRRDNERIPDTRPYERDRDLRQPPPLATGPPRHVAARPYAPHMDRDNVPPRQGPSRMPVETYPPHPAASRYDPEPYLPPHAVPSPASYSRIRPRSLSPRRDYQSDRGPPPKRVRGPEEPYVTSAPRPAQYAGQYPPPQRRPQDYPDRRPTGGSQAAYYRPDDRVPPRY